MRNILLATIFCVIFSINAYGHAVVETKIESTGQTILSAQIGANKIRAVVKTHIVDIGKPGDSVPDETNSNCTYSRYPCSLVDSIKILIDGKSIIVPRSVFSDLADLNSGNIQKFTTGMVLTLTGGDTSQAYVIEITFDTKNVLQRKLADASFPDDIWEKTIYTFKPIPNL